MWLGLRLRFKVRVRVRAGVRVVRKRQSITDMTIRNV
jgi:hypothetical protein